MPIRGPASVLIHSRPHEKAARNMSSGPPGSKMDYLKKQPPRCPQIVRIAPRARIKNAVPSKEQKRSVERAPRGLVRSLRQLGDVVARVLESDELAPAG